MPQHCRLPGEILCKQGMRMTGFVSAQTLLDFLRGNKPDLILLDIRMPEMDGTEAMGLIRALSETAAALEAASDRGDEETIRRKHPP